MKLYSYWLRNNGNVKAHKIIADNVAVAVTRIRSIHGDNEITTIQEEMAVEEIEGMEALCPAR